MESTELVQEALRICEEHKAIDPVVIDLRGRSFVTDFFVVVSGSNAIQVRAIADALAEGLADALRARPEGYQSARWVCIDLGDAVIHGFTPESREFYDLERFWRDAPRFELKASRSLQD